VTELTIIAPPRRRLLTLETLVVVTLAVGLSAARSVLSFVGAVLSPARLGAQTAQLNGSLAPGQPLLDLALQLVSILSLLLPVGVVMVVAGYSGEALSSFGLRTDRWRNDLAVGVCAAAAVGGVGLGGYLLAHQLGYSLTVVPSSLPETWWRIPVLVLAAAANAVLEEVVVVGYLIRRLEQLGWSPARAALFSSVVRASYHLYQGAAGFLGNLAMGLVFARWYQRTGRIGALIVAHTLIDVVAFCGYALLAGHVSWLPV
jgi:membrane protease YdiL (CAAX protease family)